MAKLKKILMLPFFFVVLAVAVMVVFEFDYNPRRLGDTVTILRGENALQIATDLKSEGIIDSKIFFLFEAARTGNFRNLKAGEYDMKGLGYAAIVDKLARGQGVAKKITVVPGWDMQDIAGDLRADGFAVYDEFMSDELAGSLRSEFDFLKDLPDGASLEGYLYPDTYQLPEKTTAPGVARLMLENFGKKLRTDLRAGISKQGKTIPEIMAMAAMIEKEVISLEDKKIVSGILWKRLDAGMPLQVDSTLLYYKVGDGRIINKEIDSPYNTYKYGGLPAGPICNPGIESVEAAIEPVESPYWYYLSANDGRTIFAKNYGDHLINIAKYLE